MAVVHLWLPFTLHLCQSTAKNVCLPAVGHGHTASVLMQEVFFLQTDRAVAIISIFLAVRISVLDMGKQLLGLSPKVCVYFNRLILTNLRQNSPINMGMEPCAGADYNLTLSHKTTPKSSFQTKKWNNQ